jgi:alkylation response protein AidB-like acyl-CoA dehydrogenase
MDFTPPTAEQVFALKVCAGIEELAAQGRFAAASADMVEAIAEGIGDFARGVWAPLSRAGDTEGAKLDNGVVRLPAGYAEAYQGFVEAGWGAVSAPEAFGGQALPYSLACCVLETLGAANFAFSLLPMLTVGAIEALDHHGSEDQKALFLPKLISGEWSGTMNLTEPQAGSDVGALRTTATPIIEGPHAGKYRIKGTKIFISWGGHELSGNILSARAAPWGRPMTSRWSASSTKWESTPRRPA